MVVATTDAYEESALICHLILEERDKGIALAQMAVLYRNHHDSILLQGELLARGIPYTVRSGLRFFEQAHLKDVLAQLRIVVNPRDEAACAGCCCSCPESGRSRPPRFFDAFRGATNRSRHWQRPR